MRSSPQRLAVLAKRAFQERAAEREADARLRQMQKLEGIGRLATCIVYDFNNQLIEIRDSVHAVLSTLGPTDPRRSDIERINATVSAGTQLIHQLLSFSQPKPPQATSVNLSALVIDMVAMLRVLLGEQITLQTRAAAHLWPVHADRDQVQQVVVTLVANARDAIASDGGALVGDTVALETANVELHANTRHAVGDRVDPGSYVMFAVSDNGIGIPAEVRDRIFEPFFTTKDIGEGTGLGLATVLSLVTGHRGYIACDSAPGRGTTFRVYFRRDQETVFAPAETIAAPAPAAAGLPASLLVVEDDDDVRELLVRVLTEAGYRVHDAATAAAAMAVVARLSAAPDVLLTDVVMPGINGPTLARRLVAQYPSLRVLFTSGYVTDQLDLSGLPGAPVLAKPLDMHNVVRTVGTLLSDAPNPGSGCPDPLVNHQPASGATFG